MTQASGWALMCDDLGCVNGMTIQGRKFHYDGSVEEQWAPCGRRADTCATAPEHMPECNAGCDGRWHFLPSNHV